MKYNLPNPFDEIQSKEYLRANVKAGIKRIKENTNRLNQKLKAKSKKRNK